MAVAVRRSFVSVPAGTIHVAEAGEGKPVVLFHADVTQFGWSVHRWAVTSDGQRFLVNQSLKNPSAASR